MAGGLVVAFLAGTPLARWPAQVRAPRHRGHAPRRSCPRNPVARVTAFGQSLITRSHAHLPPLHQRRHQPDPFAPGEPGAKVRTKGVRIPFSSRWEAGSGQVAVPAWRRAAGNPADSVSQQSYERTPPQGPVPRQTRDRADTMKGWFAYHDSAASGNAVRSCARPRHLRANRPARMCRVVRLPGCGGGSDGWRTSRGPARPQRRGCRAPRTGDRRRARWRGGSRSAARPGPGG